MLHHLWGKAKAHPDYDKAEWMALQQQYDGLLAACKAWLAYMDRLDAESEPGDPLAEARRFYHGKRVEMTRAAVAKAEHPRPVSIIFFANGTAAVCDQHGRQMGEFQRGDHQETIRLLGAAGHDWRNLEVTGTPLGKL